MVKILPGLGHLKQAINSLSSLSTKDWQSFEKKLRWSRFPAKSFLVEQGTTVQQIHFVVRGIVKTMYIEKSGKEITKGFVSEGQICTPYVSILTGIPANFAMIALEDAETLSLEASVLSVLYISNPAWQEIGRKIAEGLLIERERREYQMLALTAEERYIEFRLYFPHLLDRIPQYEIASYLGITAVSLSQIRRKLAGRNNGS
jgi:CRP-like cAMP-binding protein